MLTLESAWIYTAMEVNEEFWPQRCREGVSKKCYYNEIGFVADMSKTLLFLSFFCLFFVVVVVV